ncbi:dienelactone hydrolase family protein [Gaetbulibacter aestuarii]|uniref:Alpha/beta fold hydrolase n=1 Tax=Gaetbulibacter aestuarii TaxID=1502358 RepID=A0ABW7MZU4_9FLAO
MKTIEHQSIKIPVGDKELQGILTIPVDAKGLVIFSHGSGSSHLSPRNQSVSNKLNDHDFATLLFDLLTPEEDQIYSNRFDIRMLSERLITATEWAHNQEPLKDLPIGYFGASTGAASALNAAGALRSHIKAVVSRGGRPDLADAQLIKNVSASVLLLVGGWDRQVIPLNQVAFRLLPNSAKLEIIPGATHLFEEPGKLEQVTETSIRWFQNYLTP